MVYNMTRIKRLKKWRRINPYICSKCGKKRYSFIFEKAKEMMSKFKEILNNYRDRNREEFKTRKIEKLKAELLKLEQ